MMPMSMAVSVFIIIGGPNVFHSVNAAALRAPLNGPLAVHFQPDGPVRVGGVAGAASELLRAGGVDGDGIIECAWV